MCSLLEYYGFWQSPPTKNKLPEDKSNPDIREKLADYAHEAWSGWMKYMFEKLQEDPKHIHKHIERWKRQMNTSYQDLSEEEKESDREQADKMLSIMNVYKKVV